MANSISGTCGVAGATITYSGQAAGSVTADSVGAYVIPGLANGTYTIAPSLAGGYRFYVLSQENTRTVVVSSADVPNMNFACAVPGGVWTKRGQVITPSTGDLTGTLPGNLNSTIMYEGNPQVISANPDGKVFKQWYSSGGNKFCYAESPDCITWTRYNTDGYLFSGASTVSVSRVVKFASTYYLYGNVSPWSTVACWTSADGITWASANATCISASGGANWDGVNIEYFMPFTLISGLYYAIYSATASSTQVGIGIATCATLTGNWTNAASPILPNSTGSPGTIQQINGIWYLWYGGMRRTSSTDLVTWTPVLQTQTIIFKNEGANLTTGALACPTIVEVAGVTYCIYTGNDREDIGTGYRTNLSTAAMTMAQLVQTTEGTLAQQLESDNFTRADENPLSDGGNWTGLTGINNLKVATNLCQVATAGGAAGSNRTGLQALPNQYVEATVQAVQSGGDIRVLGRSTAVGTGAGSTNYFVQILGIGAGKTVKLQKLVNGSFTQLSTTQTITIAAGDKFRLICDQSTIIAQQNGVTIGTLSVTDTAILTGMSGLIESTVTTTTATNSSLWTAGIPGWSISGALGASGAGATVVITGSGYQSVTADGSGNYTFAGCADGFYTVTPSKTGYTFSPVNSAQTVAAANLTGANFTATKANYSVPDCRVAPAGPNSSRSVNGTLIYDVQTSSNAAVPSTDSRAAGAPVDSRVSPNIPQNSRTPGVFGPNN